MTFGAWKEKRAEISPRMSDEQEIAKLEASLQVNANIEQLALRAKADFPGRFKLLGLQERPIYRSGYEGECAIKVHEVTLAFDDATYVFLIEIISDEERLDWSLKLIRTAPTKEPMDIINGDETDTDLGKHLEQMYSVSMMRDMEEIGQVHTQEEGYE